MKALCCILFSTSYCSILAQADELVNWKSYHASLSHRGLPYRLMKPTEMVQGKKYPVLICLHGAGSRGKDNEKQLSKWNGFLTEKVRADYPAYILTPQSTELWNKDQLELIKEIISNLPSVDMNRIYIMGFSMGGHGTFLYLNDSPDYFAAAAPSAGSGLKTTEDFIDVERIKNVPIWAFHGDKDKTSPYEKMAKVFEDSKKVGGNMKLTTWKGKGHGIQGMFLKEDPSEQTQFSKKSDREIDFMKWLFSQKK